MNEWINDLIGIPYVHGGRDLKEGLDCYGLCKIVYLDRYHVQLPDWQIDYLDVRATNRAIEEFICLGEYQELETPEDGCFVFCYRTRAAHHVGLFYDGGVLHCRSGSGVVYEPLERFKQSYINLAFGRWAP